MDHFKLLRDFWDFAFENPEKITPNHCALYCFIINHSNRLGRKEKIGLPTEMTKEAIGMKSYNTYINTFNDLVAWGFIEVLQKSKNQYSSNIVALSYFDKALDKALDKAMLMQVIKQCKSTSESNDSIDELITKKEELITKIDKNEIFVSELLESSSWMETVGMQNKLSEQDVIKFLNSFLLKLKCELEVKLSKKELASHFVRWLPGEIQKNRSNLKIVGDTDELSANHPSRKRIA